MIYVAILAINPLTYTSTGKKTLPEARKTSTVVHHIDKEVFP